MNFWQKMITDPDQGPRAHSPIVLALIGLAFLIFDLNAIFNGSLKLGKGVNASYIHFSDHPKTFIFACLCLSLIALATLSFARDRYLMHRN